MKEIKLPDASIVADMKMQLESKMHLSPDEAELTALTLMPFYAVYPKLNVQQIREAYIGMSDAKKKLEEETLGSIDKDTFLRFAVITQLVIIKSGCMNNARLERLKPSFLKNSFQEMYTYVYNDDQDHPFYKQFVPTPQISIKAE